MYMNMYMYMYIYTQRTEDDVSIHDQIIWNLHINGIDELLLFLGGSPDEAQWCMHVLEIFFLLLREQVLYTCIHTVKLIENQTVARADDEMK